MKGTQDPFLAIRRCNTSAWSPLDQELSPLTLEFLFVSILVLRGDGSRRRFAYRAQ